MPFTNNINEETIGDDLTRLRLTAGLKQSAVAEKLKVDSSRISRIETGEIIPDGAEVQQIAKAIGSPEAKSYAEYSTQEWTVLTKPPFWHPSREVLWEADESLGQLAAFLRDQDVDGSLKAQADMHTESLSKCVKYLESIVHNIACVGDIGVGKSTAICAATDLVVENDKAGKKSVPKAVLETGGGGTTLCEVHLRSEPDSVYGLIVQPHSEEEVFRLVNDFCASIVDRHNGVSEGIRGVSQEVNRAIRNMAGLVRIQAKGESKSPTDPAMDLVKSCGGNLPELTAEVLSRIKLGTRTECEFRFLESDRQVGLKRLQQLFAEVNRGQRPDVSLPRRVDLIVPFPLLGKRKYEVRIVDTKGVDGTAIRPDLRAHLDDPRTLTVLCSRYNDAPGATMQGLVENLVNTGAESIIAERVAMLVLPREDEALAMKDDSGINAETAEEGYQLKREQAASKLAQFKGGDKVPILFFNSMEDDGSSVSKEILKGIERMRESQAERVAQISKAAEEMIKTHGQARSKAALEEVRRRLSQFLKRSSLPERPQSVHERLISGIKGAHPRTVWATTRRNGSWSGLDVYHLLGVGTAMDAQHRSQALFIKIDGVLEDMLSDAKLTPAADFVSELRRKLPSWKEKFVGDATTCGRELFRAQLFTDDVLWDKCAELWGAGLGFRNDVAANIREWCEAHTDIHEAVEKRVLSSWQDTFVDQLSKLC